MSRPPKKQGKEETENGVFPLAQNLPAVSGGGRSGIILHPSLLPTRRKKSQTSEASAFRGRAIAATGGKMIPRGGQANGSQKRFFTPWPIRQVAQLVF